MKVYQVFVDRFSTADTRRDYALGNTTGRRWLGGNLKGITNKLQYIRDLGFDAIWLTPIFSTLDYHGYSTLDFCSVDRHFGSNDTLKRLVFTAHKKGIKVLLDFVANHVSSKHKYFLSALNNKNSHYRKWFVFSGRNTYLRFVDVDTLPKLNTDNQDVINYLIDAALYWIREADIDGFRLDHAVGPSMRFWREFTRACTSYKKDFIFLPEIWLSGIDPKYTDTLWFAEDAATREKLRSILAENRGKTWDEQDDSKAEELAMNVFRKFFKTPLNFSANLKLRRGRLKEIKADDSFVFADNHDMQRLSWIKRNDPMTVNKILKKVIDSKNSVIYYGSEINMSQKKDFSLLTSFKDTECRRFMDWRKVNRKTVSDFKALSG